jgi:putative ABC transport system substrate-binding protein
MHVATWTIVLILLLNLTAVVTPPAAEGQAVGRVPRVGVLVATAPPPAPNSGLAAFRQGLRELGYVEGQSVLLEIRWYVGAGGRAALVSELLRVPVDVIVVPITGAVLDAKRATSTIPIVSAGAGALVESGAVASLARPGGNVTGLSSVTTELSAKRLQLLKEALPNLSRVAVLMSPYTGVESLGEHFLKQTEAAAQVVGVHLQVLRIEEPADLAGAFQAASRGQAGAVIILANPFFSVHAARVAELALKYRLPTMAAELAIVEAGGFMRYSVNGPDLWRRAASYVDKILKGAKPADLPVEQPTKFELVINLKTAKALGLTIPPAVLLRADQVIE